MSRMFYERPYTNEDYQSQIIEGLKERVIELELEVTREKAKYDQERFFRLDYEWHDLRKDVTDIPDLNCGLKILCYFTYHGYGVWQGFDDEAGFKRNVLGWKYIEPFKL